MSEFFPSLLQTPAGTPAVSQTPQIMQHAPIMQQQMPPHIVIPGLKPPESYDGSAEDLTKFVRSVRNFMAMYPVAFQSEVLCCRYVGTLLTGTAQEWFHNLEEDEPHVLNSWKLFSDRFTKRFQDPVAQQRAQAALRELKQGSDSVLVYQGKFLALSKASGKENASLIESFYLGLSNAVKDTLMLIQEHPRDLHGYMQLCLQIDQRITQCALERKVDGVSPWSCHGHQSQKGSQYQRTPHPDDMQVDEVKTQPVQEWRKRLTVEEYHRRMKKRMCLNCGRPGHHVSRCTNPFQGN